MRNVFEREKRGKMVRLDGVITYKCVRSRPIPLALMALRFNICFSALMHFSCGVYFSRNTIPSYLPLMPIQAFMMQCMVLASMRNSKKVRAQPTLVSIAAARSSTAPAVGFEVASAALVVSNIELLVGPGSPQFARVIVVHGTHHFLRSELGVNDMLPVTSEAEDDTPRLKWGYIDTGPQQEIGSDIAP